MLSSLRVAGPIMRFALVARLFVTLGPAAAQTGTPDLPTMCNPNWTEQSKAADDEAICLERFKDVVSRVGDDLSIKLDNGKTKKIKSNTPACESIPIGACVHYRLVGYMPAQRQFIVQVLYYESGFVNLVSRRTGKVTQLEDWPRLSPSGKRFVAVAASDAGEIKSPVAIYSTATDPPKLEWRFPEPAEYEQYAFDGWDGEDRIKLRVITQDNKPTDVMRTAKGWQIRRPNGTIDRGSIVPVADPATTPPAPAPQ